MFHQNFDQSEQKTPDSENVYYEIPIKGHPCETIISKNSFNTNERYKETCRRNENSTYSLLSTATITENMVLTYRRALPTKREEAFVVEFLKILREVCQRLGVGPSQLSGSWRRGTADCYSDIDFKVEVDYFIGSLGSVVERAVQLLSEILKESEIGEFTKIVDVISSAVPLVVLRAHGKDIDRIIDLAFVSFISPLDAVKQRDTTQKMTIIYIKQLAKERGIVQRGPWIKIPSIVMEEIVVLAVNHWRVMNDLEQREEEEHLGDILLHFCQLFCSEQSIQFGLSRWEIQQLRFKFREVTKMLCDLANSIMQIIQPHAPVLDLRRPTVKANIRGEFNGACPTRMEEKEHKCPSFILDSPTENDCESSKSDSNTFSSFLLERTDLNTPSCESSPLPTYSYNTSITSGVQKTV